MNMAEIAYKAADILAERGLCKGRNQDAEGRVCFWGAIRIAAFGMAWEMAMPDNTALVATIRLMSASILAERGVNCATNYALYSFTLSAWNDMPSTTQEDVVQLLKETGYRLEHE
jgi:hypothetical protein